jgi:RNA polymerase sigma-70 factor, ECF subfamily
MLGSCQEKRERPHVWLSCLDECLSRFLAPAHLESDLSPHSKPNEPALRLVKPDEGGTSLEGIYRRYCRYVAAVVLRLDGRDAEVDDLVQDVFVEAARGISSLRQPEAIKGWLATIAVRVVRRRLRMRRLRRFLGVDHASSGVDAVDPSASPLDRLLLRAVYQVLDDLSVEDRLAFSLHTIEGEKMESVAHLCGCSMATAKRRVARAQREIEERLGDV